MITISVIKDINKLRTIIIFIKLHFKIDVCTPEQLYECILYLVTFSNPPCKFTVDLSKESL